MEKIDSNVNREILLCGCVVILLMIKCEGSALTMVLFKVFRWSKWSGRGFFFSDINCYQTCSFSALLQLLINRESSLNKELRGLSPWGTKCIDDSVFNFKILDKIVASVPILTLTLGTSGNWEIWWLLVPGSVDLHDCYLNVLVWWWFLQKGKLFHTCLIKCWSNVMKEWKIHWGTAWKLKYILI